MLDLSILSLLSRPFITSGNVMLVQFVSDLSVTSDGFLAHYSSVPRGTEISTDDVGAVSRSTPPIPPVKPVEPRRPATTTQPPAPTVKYEPTRRPRPVQPTRGRGRENTGQDRRVPVSRPNGNGKRPRGWSQQSLSRLKAARFRFQKLPFFFLTHYCFSLQFLKIHCVPKPAKEMEPSRAVSAPVNLASFLSQISQQLLGRDSLCLHF